jgi:riboflavin kinase/FMN adenylyltransferase
MELIRGLHNLRPEHRGCAVTIGNFDGVHLGHQAVLRRLKEGARALRVPAVVMLFEPQPLEHFRPEAAPARLMRLREKLTALREQGVDRVLCVRFNARFAGLSAEAFMERVLCDRLGARLVLVGEDFRFGAGRRGDIELLRAAGPELGFAVETAPTFALDGERVSSTRVRAALAAGELETAARLLGRPYRICGRVAHGDKLGRTLGVPTANIRLFRRRAPLHGIFVVELEGMEPRALPGVASVGTRPTVDGTTLLLEVHLLDFDRDIYGAQVAVEFRRRLREERRFESLEALRAQMRRDIEQARDYFNRTPRTARAASGT